MRIMTYFISDIHGEYDLFMRLLDKIQFSHSDTLIVLGDMIEKGPQSVRVLKAVYSLPNAVSILGNHEYAFLKYYRALMQRTSSDFDRALQTLQEYFPRGEESLEWELLDWLDCLPWYLQSESYIGVHGGVPLNRDGTIKPLEEGIVEQFVYDRVFKDPGTVVVDNRAVLYGHTPTSYYNGTGDIILYLRRGGRGLSRVHLDTGVTLTGKLGCFCFETSRCFYVQEGDCETPKS